MRCIIHPSLDEEFFRARIQEVVEQLEGEEEIDFTFLVASGPEDCEELAEMSGLSPDTIRDACVGEGSSSIKAAGDDYIVISADDDFLRSNEEAVRGLIAHELMHTVQRFTGLEEDIEEMGISFTDQVMAVLQEQGFGREEAKEFLRRVVSTAILCLKDLYSNTELVDQGFSEDLEEYYYHMLGINRFCPMPEFYTAEETLDQVVEAINFELRLLPAWLPFERRQSEKAAVIRQRLQECYEANLPETSYYINRIRELYHESFEDTERFREAFFRKILESSFQLIETKLGEE